MSAQIEDPYNAPIAVSDAVAMFKSRVGSNMKPYTREAIDYNNRLVDRWGKEMLVKIADCKGTLPSGALLGMWTLYHEGIFIKRYIEYSTENHIPATPDDVITFWRTLFETSSIESLMDMGSGLVSFGWMILQNYFKRWYAEEKWARFYSKYPGDPVAWYKNYKDHKALITGKELPFWDESTMAEVTEKVGTVLMTQVKVEGMSGFRS